MKLNNRLSGTELITNDFSTITAAVDPLRTWDSIIRLPHSGRSPLKPKASFTGGVYAEQLKVWRKNQVEEDLVFAAVGLSGIASVVTAFVAAL